MEEEQNNHKIVTVTLDPSLDKTLITNHLHIGYHNHVAGTTRLDASGRGVNISRALDSMNVSTLAVVLLGNEGVGRAYRGLISEEEFPSRIVRQDGPTRSDSIIVDAGQETETHIIDEGTRCSEEDFQNVLAVLGEVVQAGDTTVFAGTLPREGAPDLYARMIDKVQEIGSQVVVLANGEPLNQALNAAPEIVALTRLEAESLFNYPVRTYVDMILGSRKLREQGAGRVLMVAEDYSGTVLVDEADALIVEISETAATGTDSGVVDAMLAGYLSGLVRGLAAQDSLALGAASMSYAATQIGNEFGSMSQIKELLNRVNMHPAEAASGLAI